MTDKPGIGTRMLRFLTIANLIFLPLLYIAENYIGERYWLTTLAMLAPQHLFAIPLLVLLPWSLIGKHKRMLKLNLVAAVFFTFALLGFNVPWRSTVRPDGIRVRVMTYNIHHAMAGVDRVADAIKAQSPDVVLMQEAKALWKYPDPVPGIQRRFPGWHIVRAGDVAILSRYPLSEASIRLLAPDTDRVALSCTVSVKGKRLMLVNTHLNTVRGEGSIRVPKSSYRDYLRRCAKTRREQAATVRRVADAAHGAVLIAGDFNTPPRGVTYRYLTGRYTDAFARAGWGFGCTYRSNIPVLRIDYIFAGDGVGVRRCWVPDTRASDHKPVVADLVLQ